MKFTPIQISIEKIRRNIILIMLKSLAPKHKQRKQMVPVIKFYISMVYWW